MPKATTVNLDDVDQAYLERHPRINLSGLVREVLRDLRMQEKMEEAK
jgi:hypothetical protein